MRHRALYVARRARVVTKTLLKSLGRYRREINELTFAISELFLSLMADWEVRRNIRGAEGRTQRWRARHFRYLGVQHGTHLTVGQSIHIRLRGKIKLGERCSLGSFAKIWNYTDIVIGDDFLSAGTLILNTGTHDPVTLEPSAKPIHIGNRVWCGVNVTILGGVTVGDDVVIAAGAVVVGDVPPNSIAGGVPAKIVRPLGRKPSTQLWKWVE